MRTTTHQTLSRLLFKALRPLVHLLIESGVGHKEFSEIAKRAYVEVASKNYGIRGRDTNISRVAVMTGLTRKEVKRIRDVSEGEEAPKPTKQVPAGRILQFWHTDDEFTDATGKLLRLNFSDTEPSFLHLTRKYAGDIPAGALRTELIRAGAAEEDEEGRLTALRREFRVVDPEEQFVWSLGRGIYGSIACTAHNFFEKRAGDKKKSGLWPSRIVEAIQVRRSDVGKVREIVAEELTTFCERLDDAIAPYSEKPDLQDPVIVRVSMTYFQDE